MQYSVYQQNTNFKNFDGLKIGPYGFELIFGILAHNLVLVAHVKAHEV